MKTCSRDNIAPADRFAANGERGDGEENKYINHGGNDKSPMVYCIRAHIFYMCIKKKKIIFSRPTFADDWGRG